MSLTDKPQEVKPTKMVQSLEDCIIKAWKGADRDFFTFTVDGEVVIKTDNFNLVVKSKRLDQAFDKKLADLQYKAQKERRAEIKFKRGF